MSHSATATDDEFGKIETEESSDVSTFADQVNAAASTMVQDDKGLWQLPEDHGLSEEVAYAANSEKRRRDTQSAAAKTSQKLEASEDRNNKLESKLKEAFVPSLSQDQMEELEDLKSSDPEEYRKKMNEYETAASEAFEEELADMGFTADEVSELADRSSELTEFLEKNPGLTLNDEVFENDLPPRLNKQLEEGEINFTEYLAEAKKVLTHQMSFNKDEDENDDPDLNKAGGGSEASNKAVSKDSEESYKTEVY